MFKKFAHDREKFASPEGYAARSTTYSDTCTCTCSAEKRVRVALDTEDCFGSQSTEVRTQTSEQISPDSLFIPCMQQLLRSFLHQLPVEVAWPAWSCPREYVPDETDTIRALLKRPTPRAQDDVDGVADVDASEEAEERQDGEEGEDPFLDVAAVRKNARKPLNLEAGPV